MNCPRDAKELTETKIHDAQVDVCPHCAGMFLHRYELDKVADAHEGDLEFSTLDEDSLDHPNGTSPVACPNCNTSPMDKVEFIIHTNIILDHCSACGGFWLDGKELNRINDEVHRLNEAAGDTSLDPPMLWFARFIWTLPR